MNTFEKKMKAFEIVENAMPMLKAIAISEYVRNHDKGCTIVEVALQGGTDIAWMLLRVVNHGGVFYSSIIDVKRGYEVASAPTDDEENLLKWYKGERSGLGDIIVTMEELENGGAKNPFLQLVSEMFPDRKEE